MPEVITRLYKQLSVRGADAAEFLQGQLTQDVESVPSGLGLPAAWCNARGRVITTMRIFARESGFELLLPAEMADTVRDKLQIYVFRSNVELSVGDHPWQCIVARREASPAVENLPETVLRVADSPDIGVFEFFAPSDQADKLALHLDISPQASDWSVALIRSGRAVIGAVNSEKFTPHMLNLDKTGAVSFSKGCYAGQEIVARTENLGTSRRRLAHFTGAAEDCRAGDKLHAGDTPIGEIVNIARGEILAVLPTDAHDQELSVNGSTLLPGIPINSG